MATTISFDARAFLSLDAGRQAALESDVLALLRSSSRGAEGLVVDGEYLETVITK